VPRPRMSGVTTPLAIRLRAAVLSAASVHIIIGPGFISYCVDKCIHEAWRESSIHECKI